MDYLQDKAANMYSTMASCGCSGTCAGCNSCYGTCRGCKGCDGCKGGAWDIFA